MKVKITVPDIKRILTLSFSVRFCKTFLIEQSQVSKTSITPPIPF